MIFSSFYGLISSDKNRLIQEDISKKSKLASGRIFLQYSTRASDGSILNGFNEFTITNINCDIIKNEIVVEMELYDSGKHNNLYKDKNLLDVLFEKLIKNTSFGLKRKILGGKNPRPRDILDTLFKDYTFVNIWLNNVGAIGNYFQLSCCLKDEIICATTFKPYANKMDRLLILNNISQLTDIQHNLIGKIGLDLFNTNDVNNIDEAYETFTTEHNFDILAGMANELMEEDEDQEEDLEELEDDQDEEEN